MKNTTNKVYLHLVNTSPEIKNEAIKIAWKYVDMIKYWEDLKKRDHLSYSYPFHQHKEIDRLLEEIVNKTKIHEVEEIPILFRDIDQKELFTRLLIK